MVATSELSTYKAACQREEEGDQSGQGEMSRRGGGKHGQRGPGEPREPAME